MPSEPSSCPPWLTPFFALRRSCASLGAPGVALAWFPLIIFWFLIGQTFFFRFPLSVLSGRIPYFFLSGEVFQRNFSIQHAGWALDQPTIGKYLLWFALFSCLSIPFGLIVRSFCSRKTQAQNIAFSAGAFLVAFWALSILSWPTSLLFQYISTMGFTFMRLAGLFVVFGSAVAWVLWAAVLSRRDTPTLLITLASLLALAGPMTILGRYFF